MNKLLQVPPEILEKVWPVVGPMLQKAIDYSRGTTTLEDCVRRVAAKEAQLWLVIDTDQGNKVMAAGVTSLQKFPTGVLICNIELFGGEHMHEWFEQKEEFEKWAKEEGCREVRLFARKGWAKHLKDYRLTHYLMTKELSP